MLRNDRLKALQFARSAGMTVLLAAVASVMGAAVGLAVRSALHGNSFMNEATVLLNDSSGISEKPVASPDSAESRVQVPKDWADSLALPTYVRAPVVPEERILSSYVPGMEPPSHSGEQRPSSARLAPWTGPVLIVRRIASDRFAAVPLNQDRDFGGIRRWGLMGDCSVRLSLDDSGATGREQGRLGDWIFGLAVPSTSCEVLERRSATRTIPTPEMRRLLAYATETSLVVRSLGAPSFSPDDLVEFAVLSVGDRRIAWGVFRRSLRTTQVIPPPPRPQLAFVAEIQKDEVAEILWARYAASSLETLAFAGAWEVEDGQIESYFGVRSPEGNRLLRVAPQESGPWILQGIHPLDP